MKRQRRPRVPRVRDLLVGLLVLTAAAVGATACGSATTVSPSRPTPSLGGAASAAAHAGKLLQTEDVVTLPRSTERLSLAYREYRRSGSWRLSDATDATAAFLENTPKHQRLSLMDLSSGRTRLIFARATFDSAGWWIGTAHLSDSWLVWEEVGPGDDLIESVGWRLYAAPMRQASLVVGRPRLVASASSAEATRPLFDVSGSRLVWISTAWAKPGTVARAQLTLRDLASGEQRVLHRSQDVLDTVNLRGDELIVGEVPRQGTPNTRLTVFDLRDGRRVAGFRAVNEYPLSHWPAWRNGWLAWTPFPTADATYPLLYLRGPSGSTYTEGGFAVDPCFVGPYVFFQTQRLGAPGEGSTVEIRALRLSDMRSMVLESGSPDDNNWWHGIVGAPELSRTYVTYLDRALFAEKDSERYTIIRVYRVD